MRYRRPDRKNALSIIEAAKKEMAFTMTLKPTEESASTIVRNIYECFRMLGDALLASRGIEAGDHLMPITTLLNVKADTKRPIQVIDNLRRLRHNINYYGYRPGIAEVREAISIAESCFGPLADAVLALVEG
ncbi:MAG: hypothetical protein ACP5E4_01385 [Candidatus Aenigmatarchaeota archaeon]